MADEKPTSRREFLRGKAAARALLHSVQSWADRAVASGESASTFRRSSAGVAAERVRTARRAMACEFVVEHHAADGPAAQDAAIAALDLVDQVETQLTIYREHSDVVEVNRTAADGPVEVEPRLFELVELCAQLAVETRGAFDMTSGGLSRLWGFLRREGRVPAQAEIDAALEFVGGQHVAVDPACRTIAFAKPGIEINFNAAGKGYALDRAAELLCARGVDDFLCHGGRSSVVAVGRQRGADVDGWRIAVPHPYEREQSVGEIVLRDEALGTSGAGTQFFEHGGRRFGHLIDPRTGWPASGVATATVVASTGAEADALSTAFYVMGPGDSAEYCATRPGIAAVLVCPREASDLFDVHAFNLDDRRWRPA